MSEARDSTSGPVSFYRRHYVSLIQAGLVLAVWFGACARAAHDFWSASVEFALATTLACAFLAGRMLDDKPIRLPLLAPVGAFLTAVALSFRGAYDHNTTFFEIWIWVFSFVMTFLFVNVVETSTDLERVLTACSVGLIPLAVKLASFLALGSELRKVLVIPNIWAQLAVVGLLLATFYAALFFIVLVVEKRDSPRMRAFFLAVFGAHVAILLFTQRTMRAESENPLINNNVLVGFALCWFFVLWKKVFERRAWLALFLPCCFILITERSWWAYVSIMAGFLVYYRSFVEEAAARHKRDFGLSVTIAAAVLTMIIGVKASQRIPMILGGSRFLWWSSAVRMFVSAPWTGVGAGGFGTAYPFFKVGHVDNTIHAHSFPLQFLAETGVAGAAAASYLAWSWWKSAAGARGNEPIRRVVCATLTAVLLFAGIHITLEYFLNKLTLLFLFGALLMGRDLPSRRIKPLYLAAAAAGLLLMIPYWLALYSSSALYMSGREAQASGDRVKAVELFKDALTLDPTNADCDFALAAIELEKFKKSGSAEDLTESRRRFQDGLCQKRDYGVIMRRAASGTP